MAGAEGTAATFTGTGRPFDLRTYPIPEPGPGEVLVRILLANVCGSDLHMWRGELDLERLRLPLPAVLGHEAVGTVEAVGPGVAADAAGRRVSEGDRVAWRYFLPCGSCRSCQRGRTRACRSVHRFISQWRSADEPPHFFGPYATHLLLPAGQVVHRVPDGVADEPASMANCAVAEVIQGLREVGLERGDTVVVQGAGGLGAVCCAVARSMGASTVIAIDGVGERLEIARAFGADAVVDVSAVPDPADRATRVKELTDGWGADVVCEFVGHAGAVAEGIRMLAPGGRYLECGCINTGTSFDLDPALLTLPNRTVHGVCYYEPWALGEALAFLDATRDRVAWELLTPVRYPLVEIDRAFADADSRSVPRASIDPWG
jgi:D-arabinose 1-dehydrogenase-like Zn-dependent alcohol dehydrogenase